MTQNKSDLIKEINVALKSLNWGSVEIYVQNNVVTQITVKNIKKTSVSTEEDENSIENNKKHKIQVLTNKKQKYINVFNRLD